MSPNAGAAFGTTISGLVLQANKHVMNMNVPFNIHAFNVDP